MEHLNKYDVIHIDMSSMWINSKKQAEGFITFLNNILFAELAKEYADADISKCNTLAMALAQINHKLGIKFVIIIDEWDTIFREEKEFVKAVASISPDRVVYVSCNPETLGRDLEWFKKCGYKAQEAWPYDMFPFTEHVECVIMMQYCGKEKKK